MPSGELASPGEDGEIVWLGMEETDTSFEDSVETKLWLMVVFAVRGLRISEAGLVSAISSFLRFLDAVTKSKQPDVRSIDGY